jgi:hypothetical protein
MHIEPELSELLIVLVGNFNPTIFQPSWFARHGLITDGAAQSAEISVIHPDITAFSIESLFTLQVERERLTIGRTAIPWVYGSDLIAKIFRDLLPHTPVSKLGINVLVHFDAGSQAKRDEIGEMLAPRGPWGEFGALVSSGEGAKHGGLQSLTLIQKNVSDRPGGWVQAKIEPSLRIRAGQSGIFMEVNDHYEVYGADGQDAQAIVAILQDKYDSSVKNSEKIIDQIMTLIQ